MIRPSSIAPFALALAALAVSPRASGAQAAGTAPSRPFTTEVVDVRTSVSSSRYVSVTLRFHNRVQRPLTLAYVQSSPVVLDDRGNRYTLNGAVRGMGLVSPSSYDPKFTIAPGESADAQFEFVWHPRDQLFGLRYELSLAVRELTPLGGGRHRAAGEYVVRHGGLGAPAVADAGAQAAATPSATPLQAPTAEVARVTGSRRGGYQYVQLALRVTNPNASPMVLCYVSRSGVGADERGNRYTVRDDAGVRGLGTCVNDVADPSFTLAAGASRDVVIEYQLGIYASTVVGTVLDASLAVLELHPLPGNQIRKGREFPLTFKGLAFGAEAAQTGNAVAAANATPSGDVLPPANDPCAGRTRCYAAGPFTAELQNVTVTRNTQANNVKLLVRVRNVTSEPLVLCFASGSAVGTDDRQNRYGVADERVQGIGVCRGGTANASFRLAPGQQRDATIEYRLGIYRNTVVGTTYTTTFTLQQLQPVAGGQILKGGEYVVNFDNVTPSGPSAATQAKGLLDQLRKATKKP